MSLRAPSERLRFVRFIARTSPPCDSLVCTACSGILGFQSKLKDRFTDDPIADALRAMTPSRMARLGRKKENIPHVLGDLPPERRRTVFEAWARTAEDAPEFAAALLTRLSPDLPGEPPSP